MRSDGRVRVSAGSWSTTKEPSSTPGWPVAAQATQTRHWGSRAECWMSPLWCPVAGSRAKTLCRGVKFHGEYVLCRRRAERQVPRTKCASPGRTAALGPRCLAQSLERTGPAARRRCLVALRHCLARSRRPAHRTKPTTAGQSRRLRATGDFQLEAYSDPWNRGNRTHLAHRHPARERCRLGKATSSAHRDGTRP